MKLGKTFYPILGVLLVCLPMMMLGQGNYGNA